MTKEELREQLKELRIAELKEAQEKIKAILDEYKVTIDVNFTYIDGQFQTNPYIKDVSS